ncbi:hypothetical protein HMPREF2899_10295 [Corynebacterium sp. HMSC072D01]|nr:hypothetical protein HMPREF2899_10295 [Corynebacterium sp. HMSC072D01]TXS68771.1 hypothetical protein CHU68_10325 [Corynebacterium sp. LK11]
MVPFICSVMSENSSSSVMGAVVAVVVGEVMVPAFQVWFFGVCRLFASRFTTKCLLKGGSALSCDRMGFRSGTALVICTALVMRTAEVGCGELANLNEPLTR